MKKFAPFNDREMEEIPIKGARPPEDVEMKIEELKTENLQNVFQGKGLARDPEEEKIPVHKEDDVAMVIDYKN